MKKFSIFLIMALLTAMMGFLPIETSPGYESETPHWLEPQTMYVTVE